MAARGKSFSKRAGFTALRAVLFALGVLTLGLSSPASAQNIFEQIFGGLRQAIEAPPRAPTRITAFADPFTSFARAINPPRPMRVETGPAKAFCVRTCDGHFFPVQAHAGLSAAQSCRSFCPASATRLYSGGFIDSAVASDGSHYADLDNAFVYRKQLVAGCTCNGRDVFGLARMDVNADPTLRPGDVVATKSGLMAFTGAKNNVADFTPVDAYRGLSKTARDKLSEMKIVSPNPGTPAVALATFATAPVGARNDDRRRAQLSR